LSPFHSCTTLSLAVFKIPCCTNVELVYRHSLSRSSDRLLSPQQAFCPAPPSPAPLYHYPQPCPLHQIRPSNLCDSDLGILLECQHQWVSGVERKRPARGRCSARRVRQINSRESTVSDKKPRAQIARVAWLGLRTGSLCKGPKEHLCLLDAREGDSIHTVANTGKPPRIFAALFSGGLLPGHVLSFRCSVSFSSPRKGRIPGHT